LIFNNLTVNVWRVTIVDRNLVYYTKKKILTILYFKEYNCQGKLKNSTTLKLRIGEQSNQDENPQSYFIHYFTNHNILRYVISNNSLNGVKRRYQFK